MLHLAGIARQDLSGVFAGPVGRPQAGCGHEIGIAAWRSAA
jgi:hypothetical protein